MKFSRRTGWTTETNALSALLASKRAKGRAVLDLSESNPTRCGFAYPDARWLGAFQDPANLVYEPDPRGLAAARDAVCRYYKERGVAVTPDRVFLASGTSEAYSHVLRLLADPGDAVAIPAPGYPLFDLVLDLNDAVASRYRSVYAEGAWRIDAASLEEACAEHPKAVVVVNPNNPTGHGVSPKELDLLNRFCRQAGAAIVADEVFLDYASGGAAGKSLAGNRDVLTFTLSGVSKVLGLPQMKLSWIVVSGPDDAVKTACERLETIADTYLSVGTPAQRALPSWLERAAEPVREISARVAANRMTLERAAAESGAAHVLRSEGGWYAVLDCPSVKDDETFALSLLQKHDVFVHPGYFFDFAEEGRIVVSLLPPPEAFAEGVKKLFGML